MPGKPKNKKCRRLGPGGKIGIVATGSPVQPGRLSAGIKRLTDLGFRVEVPLDPAKYYGKYDHGFANGSPQERAAALMQLVDDDEVQAIFAARGGYGTLDILPLLDYARIEAAKKTIVGYSDVTALLAAVHLQTGLATVHGPTVSKEIAESADSAESQADLDWLLALLGGETKSLGGLSCRPLDDGISRPDKAAGPVVAGNLTMLQTLLGTSYDLPFDGAVVVLEEIGEQPYRIHRALTQLAFAGKFEKAAAVVFGRLSGCEGKHGPSAAEVLRICSAALIPASVPVFSGLEFGHNGANRALPFGGGVTIENGILRIEESPVQ